MNFSVSQSVDPVTHDFYAGSARIQTIGYGLLPVSDDIGRYTFGAAEVFQFGGECTPEAVKVDLMPEAEPGFQLAETGPCSAGAASFGGPDREAFDDGLMGRDGPVCQFPLLCGKDDDLPFGYEGQMADGIQSGSCMGGNPDRMLKPVLFFPEFVADENHFFFGPWAFTDSRCSGKPVFFPDVGLFAREQPEIPVGGHPFVDCLRCNLFAVLHGFQEGACPVPGDFLGGDKGLSEEFEAASVVASGLFVFKSFEPGGHEFKEGAQAAGSDFPEICRFVVGRPPAIG